MRDEAVSCYQAKRYCGPMRGTTEPLPFHIHHCNRVDTHIFLFARIGLARVPHCIECDSLSAGKVTGLLGLSRIPLQFGNRTESGALSRSCLVQSFPGG